MQKVSSSCQVLHNEEHDEAGDGHPPQHEELVLEGTFLNQPHHRVGQAQHVGNVQDLLVSALRTTTQQRHNHPHALSLLIPQSKSVSSWILIHRTSLSQPPLPFHRTLETTGCLDKSIHTHEQERG